MSSKTCVLCCFVFFRSWNHSFVLSFIHFFPCFSQPLFLQRQTELSLVVSFTFSLNFCVSASNVRRTNEFLLTCLLVSALHCFWIFPWETTLIGVAGAGPVFRNGTHLKPVLCIFAFFESSFRFPPSFQRSPILDLWRTQQSQSLKFNFCFSWAFQLLSIFLKLSWLLQLSSQLILQIFVSPGFPGPVNNSWEALVSLFSLWSWGIISRDVPQGCPLLLVVSYTAKKDWLFERKKPWHKTETRSSAGATAVRSPPHFVPCFHIGPNWMVHFCHMCTLYLAQMTFRALQWGGGGPWHPIFVWTTKWPPYRNR